MLDTYKILFSLSKTTDSGSLKSALLSQSFVNTGSACAKAKENIKTILNRYLKNAIFFIFFSKLKLIYFIVGIENCLPSRILDDGHLCVIVFRLV